MMACASRRDIQSRQSTKASHHTKRTGHKPCFFVIFFLVLWGFAPFRANARHAEACLFDGLRQQKGYPIPTTPPRKPSYKKNRHSLILFVSPSLPLTPPSCKKTCKHIFQIQFNVLSLHPHWTNDGGIAQLVRASDS